MRARTKDQRLYNERHLGIRNVVDPGHGPDSDLCVSNQCEHCGYRHCSKTCLDYQRIALPFVEVLRQAYARSVVRGFVDAAHEDLTRGSQRMVREGLNWFRARDNDLDDAFVYATADEFDWSPKQQSEVAAVVNAAPKLKAPAGINDITVDDLEAARETSPNTKRATEAMQGYHRMMVVRDAVAKLGSPYDPNLTLDVKLHTAAQGLGCTLDRRGGEIYRFMNGDRQVVGFKPGGPDDYLAARQIAMDVRKKFWEDYRLFICMGSGWGQPSHYTVMDLLFQVWGHLGYNLRELPPPTVRVAQGASGDITAVYGSDSSTVTHIMLDMLVAGCVTVDDVCNRTLDYVLQELGLRNLAGDRIDP